MNRASESTAGRLARTRSWCSPQSGRAVEQEAAALLRERHRDRPLAANVEFYTAVLLDAVGLHRGLFTPAFAIARVAGWLAHIDEHSEHGRIIRPKAHYVGLVPYAA